MGLVCPYKEIGGRHSCCGAVDEGSRCSNAGCYRGASAILGPVQGVKGAGIGTAMVSVMAAAWIESLAGEPPCTTGAAIKNEKERQKEWIEFSSSLSLSSSQPNHVRKQPHASQAQSPHLNLMAAGT